MAYAYETDYNLLSLTAYAERKIWMLKNEFKIKLTKADEKHMYELPTKDAMDAFCRKLFSDKL
jgi:hypothetical protein